MKDTSIKLRNLVLYQVFVRNHTPEGDFAGLRRDLGRIRELGVDFVYLLPVHPIGVKNRKGTLGSPYSIRDYRAINPEYGTLRGFPGARRRRARARHETDDGRRLQPHVPRFASACGTSGVVLQEREGRVRQSRRRMVGRHRLRFLRGQGALGRTRRHAQVLCGTGRRRLPLRRREPRSRGILEVRPQGRRRRQPEGRLAVRIGPWRVRQVHPRPRLQRLVGSGDLRSLRHGLRLRRAASSWKAI
ncbi:MAG: alpha-amylase family glycosyl hydrolase [Candidatus Moduliflexus flocculans]|nr:alpha-amylase family glycosyl hydrolase [Candidatus Moduliflexus flocculans]